MALQRNFSFFDKNEKGQGTFLGRTRASWFKIGVFYIIYYSFLSALIYFTVTTYANNLKQPGARAGTINTRLDQPGASIEPLNLIQDSQENQNYLDAEKEDGRENKAFVEKFQEFEESYITNKTVSVCRKGDVANKCCKIPNLAKIDTDAVRQSIKDYSPIFTIQMNKRFGWTPFNKEGQPNYPSPFVADSIQVTCRESQSDGAEVDKSQFKVENIGIEKAILPKYFPYHAKDKLDEEDPDFVAYNKPFLVFQIKPEDGAKSWKFKGDVKKQMKYFRCEIFADNIERPLTGTAFYDDASDNEKSWSNDLTKLGVGFVQFGFSYTDKQE